ncbi:hypothetical protein PSTT_11544 [Puccinia striiformis]|uniref:DNA 3'-5' helicase n=1 Tax=Puccinia striiformis TaxID=27350 RepID=A0A2S4UZU8_9BASI|nr:hypothetical protein PSTT_11544 [Puccinia striiformis]
MPQKKIKKTSKVTLTVKLLAMNDTDLKQAIIEDARPCYPADQPWKPVEIEGAFNLARRRHTFVRAGTGSCKSRVAKVYCHLFAKTKNPVVLVLNPLDALGTNQVQEKIAQGFTAINLKQTNFNKSVAGEILPGKYNFIYLSPEIFLNNKMFTGVYHNQKFQDHLVLTVVDEAHMIYMLELWPMPQRGSIFFFPFPPLSSQAPNLGPSLVVVFHSPQS